MRYEVHWHWNLPYDTTLSWQLQRRQGILDGSKSETVLFAEHPSCVTLGKRGGQIDQTALTNDNISIHQIKRGGLATWHGPGQLVFYPIFHIQKRKIGIRSWICILQKSILSLLNTWNIPAYADTETAGIWVQNKKIASIGLEIHKGVSIHGCALNISNTFDGFALIAPCGHQHMPLTNLQSLISSTPTLHQISQLWLWHFEMELKKGSSN